MTEIHAALGLANLKYYEEVLEDRKRKYHLYLEALGSCGQVSFQKWKHGEPNYSYFPVLFPSEDVLHRVQKDLAVLEVYPRRYFYPSVNTFHRIVDYQPAPVSEDISRRILCLPLYWGLSDGQIAMIAEEVTKSLQ